MGGATTAAAASVRPHASSSAAAAASSPHAPDPSPLSPLRHTTRCSVRSLAQWTSLPLRSRLRYALTGVALLVLTRMLLLDVPSVRSLLLPSSLSSQRYVGGKRCEHVSVIHVESAFHDPAACFSRADIQQIILGLVWAIHDVFERHELPYWLDSGTLLGSYRDKTVIPHDTDADIGVDAATFERIRDGQWDFPSVYELQVHEGKFHKAGFRDTGIPGRLIHKHSGFYVDIFVFYDETAAASASSNSNSSLRSPSSLRSHSGLSSEPNSSTDATAALFGPEPSMCFSGCRRCPQVSEHAFAFAIPKSWVFPLQPCWFGGRVASCPAETEKYLDYLYGPDFMTPDN